MRINLHRNVVFGFIGAVGLVGSAQARPFDRDGYERPVPTERHGTPPEHIMRSEIAIHAFEDGRGDTSVKTDLTKHDAAFNTPNNQRPDGRMTPPEMPNLPIKSDIKNRIELRDGEEADPKLGKVDVRHSHGGQNTFREPSNQAPIQIQTSISQKVIAGEDSEIAVVVRPEARGLRSHDPNATRSRIGDASEAERLDPRTYPHIFAPGSPAKMFMSASVKMRMHGGGDGQADEK